MKIPPRVIVIICIHVFIALMFCLFLLGGLIWWMLGTVFVWAGFANVVKKMDL